MATRRTSSAKKKKTATSKKKTSRRATSKRAELADVRDHVAAIEAALDEIRATLPELARTADVVLLTELLQEFPSQLSASSDVGEEPRVPPSSDSHWRSSVEELASSSAAAARAIHEALDGLPRNPEYERFASQLRELAMVSPSLLDWLSQVPQLTQPLADSTSELRRAAGQLEAVNAKAEALLLDSLGSQPIARRANRRSRNETSS